MAKNESQRERGPFGRWFHRNFDDLFFRALIGPAQVDYAICGTDQAAREQWKRDLEARKRYTRELRERRQLHRRAGRVA